MYRKKNIVIVVMIVMMVFMGVGYAILQTQLKINGTANLTGSWNVAITNVTSTATGRAYNIKSPTYTATTMTFSVGVKEPGDKMTFKVTVKNSGNIGAILNTIDATDSGSAVIKHSISGIQSKTRLAAGASITFTVTTEFDIGATTIPDDLIKELVIRLNYIQDDGQTLTPENPTIVDKGIELRQKILNDNIQHSDSGVDFATGVKVSTYKEKVNEERLISKTRAYAFGSSYTFDKTTGRYKLSGTIVNSTLNSLPSSYVNYPYTLMLTSSTETNYYLYKITDISGSNAKATGYAFEIDETTEENGLYYTSTNTWSNLKTYYFRGLVKNNYVNFAGFTWRIVRINEDGSIRLIFYGTNPTTIGNLETSAYSSSSVLYSSSTMKTFLDNWYKNNLQTYSSYLADTGFCNDMSGETSTRLSAGTPQFKCSRTSDLYTVTNSAGNRTLTYPIALITLDEIMYAGMAIYGSGSGATYLNNLSTWTMSQVGTKTNYPYYISGDSFEGVIPGTATIYSGRPVINLKADTKIISTGNGTASNPYVIKTS